MSCKAAEGKYDSSRLSKVNPATFYLACDYPIPISLPFNLVPIRLALYLLTLIVNSPLI